MAVNEKIEPTNPIKCEKRLARQRRNFLGLLLYGKNIVIEINGKHNYCENEQASSELYSEIVAQDRRLKLTGYELYKFWGYEFLEAKEAQQAVKDFFRDLFKLYSISESQQPNSLLARASWKVYRWRGKEEDGCFSCE